MPGNEKVTMALELHRARKCRDENGELCPYWEHYDDCYTQLVDDILSLLKEQEEVKPECQIIFDVPYYFCGNCKTMLNMYAVKAKYCSNCGRRVKWG